MVSAGYVHPARLAGVYTPTRGQFAGQAFPSYRQYQNTVARTKGFTSVAKRLATPRAPIAKAMSLQGSTAGRASQAVLELRRNPNLSLAQAAKNAHTTPAAVKRHAGKQLTKRGNKVVVKKVDTLVVRMKIDSTNGTIAGFVRGSKTRDRIGKHSGIVGTALKSPSAANIRRLARYRGHTVTLADGTAVPLLWDYYEALRLATQGKLDPDGPYDDADLELDSAA